jgi:hypothetical protein
LLSRLATSGGAGARSVAFEWASPAHTRRKEGSGGARCGETFVALGRSAAGSKGCPRASSRPLSALSPRLPAGFRNCLLLLTFLLESRPCFARARLRQPGCGPGDRGGSLALTGAGGTRKWGQNRNLRFRERAEGPTHASPEQRPEFREPECSRGLKARPKTAQGNALGINALQHPEP